MAYAGQILINFLQGNGGDQTITNGSAALVNKGTQRGMPSLNIPAPPVQPALGQALQQAPVAYQAWCAQFAQAVGQMPRPWRLYLRGHGNRQQKTLGGWGAPQVARLLVDGQLGTNLPGMVSVTGCRSALDQNGPPNLVQVSANNFVADLHRFLGAQNILVRMVGRTIKVTVRTHGPDVGRKVTRAHGQTLAQRRSHQPGSKVEYWWANGGQQGGIVNLPTPMDVEVDAMDIDDPEDPMEVDPDFMDVA